MGIRKRKNKKKQAKQPAHAKHAKQNVADASLNQQSDINQPTQPVGIHSNVQNTENQTNTADFMTHVPSGSHIKETQPVQPVQSMQPVQPAHAQPNPSVQNTEVLQPVEAVAEAAGAAGVAAVVGEVGAGVANQTNAETEQMTPEKLEQINRIKGRMDEVKTTREIESAKQQRNKRIILIIAIILVVYLMGVVFFSIFTWPRTTIADTDVSLKTESGLVDELSKCSTDYRLSVFGIDFNLEIPGKSIDYSFDANQVASNIESQKNPFAWPVEVFKKHDFENNFVVSFNQDKVKDIVVPAVTEHNKNTTKPQDAGFIVDKENKTVAVKKEVLGSALNEESTLDSINKSIGTAKQYLELGEKEHLLPNVFSGDPRFNKAYEQAQVMVQSSFPVVLAGTPVSTVGINEIAQWIYCDSSYTASLEPTLLSNWTAAIATQCNSVGQARTYTAPYGKAVTVEGGSAGWLIDQEALNSTITSNVQKGNVSAVEIPCQQSMTAFTGKGGRDWGPRYIDIDLGQQHARMYNEAGALVWETDIVSGKPNGKDDTPSGVWRITNKQSPSKLIGAWNAEKNGPEYESTVQYWMPFVGNSIGIHDATWQSGFGGSRYRQGAGSHGCINVSLNAAAAIYGICQVGDIVVTHW